MLFVLLQTYFLSQITVRQDALKLGAQDCIAFIRGPNRQGPKLGHIYVSQPSRKNFGVQMLTHSFF